jgi:diguanylate cyclase (GGDEF)-like protein
MLALSALGIVLYALWLAVEDDPGLAGLATLADVWVYNLTILFAGIACFVRAALTREARGAWIALGLGLVSWTFGDVYWSIVLVDLKRIPYPSPADIGYLLAIPFFFAGIALLLRRRIGHFTLASWFDGAIAALAAAAAATAVLAPALIGLTKGDPATVFTNLAYPVGDLLLVGFAVGALALTGFRGAGPFLLIGAGLVIWTGADIAYLWTQAKGTPLAAWTDLLWLAGALLIGLSAAFADSKHARPRAEYRSGLLLPAISTAVAVGILVTDHFDELHVGAIWLAAATLVAVGARLTLSFRDNDRLVHALHDDSVTDPLTGLGNRRALLGDLEHLLAQPKPGDHLFGLFDLDGFKAYNDSFGHPAGDALLRRLGTGLNASIGRIGTAYRLGGDEFCILVPLGSHRASPTVEMARAALSERGEGFAIGASGGAVRLPHEAGEASEALRIADQRMYAEKGERPLRTDRQTREVLLRIMRHREPEMESHADDVTRLAVEVGREMGLDGEEIDVLARAAEMHDVGKIAIPDEILNKPGQLDQMEWELMRRHTLIGERILGASPALAPVAALVRCAHERWDGAGYPDGLRGDEIPLGSRIIFVCDAFDAMTSDRPYKQAMTETEALAELRLNAGTQFDPAVVNVFTRLAAVRPQVLTRG